LHHNDLEKAIAEVEAKAAQLSRGDIDAVQLTGRDRLVYGRALEAIRDHALPLDAAAIEYSEARKLLDGVTLVDAARFYSRHHGRGITRKSVGDAVDAYDRSKENQRRQRRLSFWIYVTGSARSRKYFIA